MAIKKYLYREDEEVFKKIDLVKQKHTSEKFSTKDSITYLINKGFEVYIKEADKELVPNLVVPSEVNTGVEEVK